MTYSNLHVAETLGRFNIKLKSQVKYSKLKDHAGQWTNFMNGDRFVYVDGEQT